jgi:hypothetical protein
VVSISTAVKRGVAKANRKVPAAVFVTSAHPTATDVTVIKQGVCVSLRNWGLIPRTGQANCGVYVSRNGGQVVAPRESTLSGGTIEELIQSTVMAVALGVYDV